MHPGKACDVYESHPGRVGHRGNGTMGGRLKLVWAGAKFEVLLGSEKTFPGKAPDGTVSMSHARYFVKRSTSAT